MPKQISVTELNERMQQSKPVTLIDCREEDENKYCHIEGAQLIPLSKFKELAPQQLKMDDEIFIHCHHGGRSMQACLFLESLGYKNTVNVAGGIEAWSLQVDPKVPRY